MAPAKRSAIQSIANGFDGDPMQRVLKSSGRATMRFAYPLGGGRMGCQFLRRATRANHQFTPAVGTLFMQHARCAGRTEGAFEGTDSCVRRLGRKIAIAAFAVGPELKHSVSVGAPGCEAQFATVGHISGPSSATRLQSLLHVPIVPIVPIVPSGTPPSARRSGTPGVRYGSAPRWPTRGTPNRGQLQPAFRACSCGRPARRSAR